MKEFEFTLEFKLPESNENPEAYLDALFEAGCDDALIGTGERGYIALDFSREGEDSIEAMRSALLDVYKAIPGAKFEKASPDLVNLSDVADVVGVSRQYIHNIYTKNKMEFPKPYYSGKQVSLWRMANVMTFIIDKQLIKKKVYEELMTEQEMYFLIMHLNNIKGLASDPLSEAVTLENSSLNTSQRKLDAMFLERLQHKIMPLVEAHL